MAPSRSSVRLPAGAITIASRMFGPWSRSHASMYPWTGIGRNNSPCVKRRIGSWRRSSSRSVAGPAIGGSVIGGLVVGRQLAEHGADVPLVEVEHRDHVHEHRRVERITRPP